jgi:chaperonin cofactor prefoldin
MDKTTVRTWDPTAPSLLWAHQIRRENIHLVNQLDSTSADLAGAISSINELKQQLSELREQTQKADTDTSGDTCDRRLKDITQRLETRFEGISGRIEAVERENGRLKERLDGVERGCSEHTGLDGLKELIRRQVLDEVQVWFTREKEGLQCPHGNGM